MNRRTTAQVIGVGSGSTSIRLNRLQTVCCGRRDPSEILDLRLANLFAIGGAGGRDGSGLQQPELTLGQGPFDIARLAVIDLDLTAQFRQLRQLGVVQTEPILLIDGDFLLALRCHAEWFCAGAVLAHDSIRSLDLKRIRRHTSGDDGLAQAPRRLDQHLFAARIMRIAREQHAGDLRRHEPLHDDGHRQIGFATPCCRR